MLQRDGISGKADHLMKLLDRHPDLDREFHQVRSTKDVFQTETDVMLSAGFELRPLHVSAETDGAAGA